MDFTYSQPRQDVRQYVSSYYDVLIPRAFADIMRAEIANIRIILEGRVQWDLDGVTYNLLPGDAVLCGPTFMASRISFASNTHIFGMAVTPSGWAHMFGGSAEDTANKIVALGQEIPPSSAEFLRQAIHADDPASLPDKADNLIASLIIERPKIHTSFLDEITAWLTDPEPNELSDLLASMNLSHRQIDRLCRTYFGASPKKLHRKFRALHSANILTWQKLSDWRDVATTAYFDQSHFIREFKQFNGRTPSEFINGAHLLVKQTLEQRLQIRHESPFSLVG